MSLDAHTARMPRTHPSLCVLLALLACSTPPSTAAADPRPVQVEAPTEAKLQVRGGNLRSADLGVDELEALGGEDVVWTFRDRAHTYRALRLDRLLLHLGFDRGPGGATTAPANRRPGWRLVLVARARDGFWSPFTLAELMPEMGPTRAYVAWRRDGQPIDAEEGPLRLIVPTDLKGSRSVRMLTQLEVLDGTRLAAGGASSGLR